MSERKPQFKPIEKALIDSAASLKNPNELITELEEKGFRETDILGSIWALISRGHLDMDAGRRIQASPKHPHQLPLMPPYEQRTKR